MGERLGDIEAFAEGVPLSHRRRADRRERILEQGRPDPGPAFYATIRLFFHGQEPFKDHA
jgi:hypothetical protein